jgi:hypothetical protein
VVKADRRASRGRAVVKAGRRETVVVTARHANRGQVVAGVRAGRRDLVVGSEAPVDPDASLVAAEARSAEHGRARGPVHAAP